MLISSVKQRVPSVTLSRTFHALAHSSISSLIPRSTSIACPRVEATLSCGTVRSFIKKVVTPCLSLLPSILTTAARKSRRDKHSHRRIVLVGAVPFTRKRKSRKQEDRRNNIHVHVKGRYHRPNEVLLQMLLWLCSQVVVLPVVSSRWQRQQAFRCFLLSP